MQLSLSQQFCLIFLAIEQTSIYVIDIAIIVIGWALIIVAVHWYAVML
jgi:hypothetical protein